jgi:hypothetical protein
LQIKGRALYARWFVKHYPFWILIAGSFLFNSGAVPTSHTEFVRTFTALKIIGFLIAGFIGFNYFCLRSTGVLFHTLVANPEVATSERNEALKITDLIETGFVVKNRITVLRLMALALDLILIHFIVGYML